MKNDKLLNTGTYMTFYAESQTVPGLFKNTTFKLDCLLKLIIPCLNDRGTRSTMRRRRRSRRSMRRRWATSPTWARTQRSSQVCLANNHCFGQCCGSGMFMPDRGSASASKNLSILKTVSKLSGNMIRVVHPGSVSGFFTQPEARI